MPIITSSLFVSLLVFLMGFPFQNDAQAKAQGLEAVLKGLSARGTQVSAEIVNLTNSRELLKVNPETPLNPASSVKLFTAYVALSRLGIHHAFKTKVYQIQDESLCVKGGGDPSFVMEDLYLLVQGLKRKGLSSYSGRITLDASVFDDEFYPEDRSDQDSERAYNAPIAGLNFNYNTISVFVNPTTKGKPARVGLDFPFDFVKVQGKVLTSGATEVTWDKTGKGDLEIVHLGGKISENAPEWRKPFRIRKPARAFGEALALMLEKEGVRPKGGVSLKEGTCISSEGAFYEYESKPLSFIVHLMNKYSNNFIADSLVKALDHEVNRRAGTADGGLKFMRTELQKIGIPTESKGRVLVSGSGLTLGNRMSASDFTKLLRQVHKEKALLPEMFASLPVAAIDGTLKRKYKETAVAQLLRGKTGSLTGVQSLVGVYPNSEGEWLGVSIIVNGGAGIPEAELARFLGAH
jgi:D-alanyl-D-alanine carboxypeptidase/D-alanyl-D-alanine-endopeptidase (penicillin-binding protein 4)